MSFTLSFHSELIKTKRTAAFWMTVIGAAFIPAIFFLAYLFNADKVLPSLQPAPWDIHFSQGWQSLNSFLFPMYIILICALIPQIEYKSNAWKQVFASPQPVTTFFFSKFLTVHLMIFLFYFLFNLFMILSAIAINLINEKFLFFENSIRWEMLMKLNLKTYISILGVSAVQFFLSLRFKSFIGPVGIGLAILVASLVASGFGWDHIFKIPHAHPILTLKSMMQPERPFLENHEWNSIGYFVLFTLIGYLTLKLRKDKG